MHSQPTLASLVDTDTLKNLLKIPDSLQPYLTVAERPPEIYRSVERERDRRIRLLLRRFTNQIQYGCTNPYCTVSTCFTYRKRTATGPLRPHTDLSARALAVRCIEQYTNHGRDIPRPPSREKGKRSYASPETDGLCWSDPVIPWYADPNEYLARRKVVVRKRSRSTTSHESPPVKPVPLHAESVSKDEHKQEQTASDNIPSTRSATRKDIPPVEALQTQYGTAPTLHFTGLQSNTGINGHLKTPGTADSHTTIARYDDASLTQTLFRHPELQGLCAPTETLQPSHPSHASNRPTSSAASTLGILYNRQPGITFQILPMHVVGWFGHMLVDSPKRNEPSREHLRSFLNQCLHYVFANPQHLLRSAHTWHRCTAEPPDATAECCKRLLPPFQGVRILCHRLNQCFPDSDQRFRLSSHLHGALQCCYALPRHIKRPSETNLANSSFMTNFEVACVVLLILNMIMSARPDNLEDMQRNSPARLSTEKISKLRDAAHAFTRMGTSRRPIAANDNAQSSAHAVLAFSQYQFDLLPLCETIADLVSHRIAIDHASAALQDTHNRGIIDQMVYLLRKLLTLPDEGQSGAYRAMQVLDYMQILVYMKWDRKSVVRRTSPVGGALEILKGLYIQKRHLGLSETWFIMSSMSNALDEVETPFEWLFFQPDATKMHILQFSFLFPPNMVVRYFRSLNLKLMKNAHEKALAIHSNGRSQLLHGPWQVANVEEVLDATRPHMARYFVMTIRRSHILEDAIGQIWQREKQELTRPLKVILGKDEGEDGLDHGGVQQEFFRLVFAEAFDPKYAMFETDSTTYMTWFKPRSCEPLYKYEALGILMSLAIYNGVTIPITMPLAFYRKILGFKVKQIEHIEDGWPEIANSFRQLLDWDEGDVEDVMALNFEFSYESLGETVTIDMAKRTADPIDIKGKGKATWYDPLDDQSPHRRKGSFSDDPASNPPTYIPTPVTNANRHAFVRAYITHLTTTTINAQFTSFLQGLHTLLSPTALSLFSPSHLKLLFEGQPASEPLSIRQWRRTTKYEDFELDHPLITWFWDILENDMTQAQLRKLLEFVTASNRLPVGGWEGVTFLVQRNGSGDDRLPGSSTCYGRLLLPEYSCREVLKERLIKAVEEGFGFGMI